MSTAESSSRLQVPRFDVAHFKAQIAARPAVEHEALWHQLTLAWAEALRDALDVTLNQASPRRARYRVDYSPRLIVVSSLPQGAAAKWPAFGEGVMDTIAPFLDPIDVHPPWPTAVCFLHDVPTFDAYLRAVTAQNRLVPGGRYIDADGMLPHIAILGTMEMLQLRLAFIHELIHSRIHRPDLPLWIEEGICHHVEMTHLRLPLMYADNVDLQQNRYWREHNLSGFWTGAAWGAHGEPAPYLLARRIVQRLLAENPDRFFAFVQQAHVADAGDAASRAIYGRPILDIACEFLGAGNWLPPVAPLSR